MLYDHVPDNLPQGFSMALLQNPVALSAYENLPPKMQQHYLDRAKTVPNKVKMTALIEELGFYGNRFQ